MSQGTCPDGENLTCDVLAILIFVFRGSEGGYVCSGWYLSDAELEDPDKKRVYDIEKGLFLFVIMILNAIGLGCSCCLICTLVATQMAKG